MRVKVTGLPALEFSRWVSSPLNTRVGIHVRNLLEARVIITPLYLVCICPIRSLCVSGDWIGFRREAVHILRRVVLQPGL
jgi:hypothetical protein